MRRSRSIVVVVEHVIEARHENCAARMYFAVAVVVLSAEIEAVPYRPPQVLISLSNPYIHRVVFVGWFVKTWHLVASHVHRCTAHLSSLERHLDDVAIALSHSARVSCHIDVENIHNGNFSCPVTASRLLFVYQ